MIKLGDLSGKKFGKLTAIRENGKDKHNRKIYLCKCDCGTKNANVMQYYLTSGETKSCGCLSKETTSKIMKKYNEYDLSGEYGIGYASNGGEFYFDLDDYELIKDICWRINSDGYLVGRSISLKRDIRMNRLILGLEEKDVEIVAEHENRKRNDNRRKNLRKASTLQNTRNQSVQKKSKTGVTGVTPRPSRYEEDGFFSRINNGSKEIFLGSFTSFEEAVKVRLFAEKEYFGEFAPQKHLFKEYEIE